jgi:hypothetical protein
MRIGAVTEQRRDRFEAHPSVDRLGREGVAELVRVHVPDTGALGDGGDVAGDGAAVEGLTVVAFEEHAAAGWSAVVAVVGDELDQDRVQRDVAVVVELADRDAKPERVADADHRVVTQCADLAGAHAGPGEDLDHEPAASVGIVRERGHELRGGRVVEELRERLVGLGEVAGEHGDLARCVVVVPVDDPFEERSQQAQVVPDRGRRQRTSAPAAPLCEPLLVVLEFGPTDRCDAHAAGVRFGDASCEQAQHQRVGGDGAGSCGHGELVEEPVHRQRHLRCSRGDVRPADLLRRQARTGTRTALRCRRRG